MRIALSLASLLLVLFIVMKLSSQQAKQLVQPETGQKAADQAAQQVQKAMEQGAAARASDAESR